MWKWYKIFTFNGSCPTIRQQHFKHQTGRFSVTWHDGGLCTGQVTGRPWWCSGHTLWLRPHYMHVALSTSHTTLRSHFVHVTPHTGHTTMTTSYHNQMTIMPNVDFQNADSFSSVTVNFFILCDIHTPLSLYVRVFTCMLSYVYACVRARACVCVRACWCLWHCCIGDHKKIPKLVFI